MMQLHKTGMTLSVIGKQLCEKRPTVGALSEMGAEQHHLKSPSDQSLMQDLTSKTKNSEASVHNYTAGHGQ